MYPPPPPSDILPSSAPSIISGLSTIAPSASVSQAAVPISTHRLTYHEQLKPQLIAALGIDATLTDQSVLATLSLAQCWERYKAVIRALKLYDDMVKDKSWIATDIPNQTDREIIEIFLGKSLFYDHWKKVFDNLADRHPDMCDWLEHNPNRKSDFEVWGITQTTAFDRNNL
jgi:hypothetical protein